MNRKWRCLKKSFLKKRKCGVHEFSFDARYWIGIDVREVVDLNITVFNFTVLGLNISLGSWFKSAWLCILGFSFYWTWEQYPDTSTDESFADFATSLTPDDDEWYLIDHPDMEESK